MASNLGFKVLMPEDAVATFARTGADGRHHSAQSIHDSHLASLHGEFVTVTDTATLLADVRRALTEHWLNVRRDAGGGATPDHLQGSAFERVRQKGNLLRSLLVFVRPRYGANLFNPLNLGSSVVQHFDFRMSPWKPCPSSFPPLPLILTSRGAPLSFLNTRW